MNALARAISAPARTSFRIARFALAACLWLASVMAAAQSVELGDAPVREGSQDTTWGRPTAPKAALSRAEVAALYRGVYLSANSVPLIWTGSIASCNAGASNIEHQQAVIGRVNYFRALVDLPPVSLLPGTETGQVQAAALVMSANNALNHTPPATWTCYSAAGAAGAGRANLSLGASGVAAIDNYMDDFGSSNSFVGHRRWILYPPSAGMATGDVPGGNTPPRPANALYILGPTVARPPTPNGIAWPPAGFVPYQNLPSGSNRWSFSYPGADFSNATVTVTGPDGAIPVTYETMFPPFGSNSFLGDNTLVFLPSGVSYQRPAADTAYTIVVSGIAGKDVPTTFAYSVTVIDPSAAGPTPQTVDVIEYYNASLDHYFITWVAAEIANLDAGRTPTRWLRTGYTFKAYVSAQAGAAPVCRFYIPPGLGDSHFFGRGTGECNDTASKFPQFVLEEPNFMFMFLPAAGACPAGTVPIYRVFSNRPDANHRYMTDPAVRDEMVMRGWLAEGDGPDRVAMCAPM